MGMRLSIVLKFHAALFGAFLMLNFQNCSPAKFQQLNGLPGGNGVLAAGVPGALGNNGGDGNGNGNGSGGNGNSNSNGSGNSNGSNNSNGSSISGGGTSNGSGSGGSGGNAGNAGNAGVNGGGGSNCGNGAGGTGGRRSSSGSSGGICIGVAQASASDWQSQVRDCEDGSGAHCVHVCHVPPGEPQNAHTIDIDINAVQAHLSHSTDYVGDCRQPSDTPCDPSSAKLAGD